MDSRQIRHPGEVPGFWFRSLFARPSHYISWIYFNIRDNLSQLSTETLGNDAAISFNGWL